MDEQLKWELIQAALDGEELDRITEPGCPLSGKPPGGHLHHQQYHRPFRLPHPAG